VTFKDLRRIIAEKNKELVRESKLYDPNYYWRGRKIVSMDQWYQIKEGYGLEAALQFFPNDFPRFGFSYVLDNIEDQALKQEADNWDSEFLELMEYIKNTEYGKTKCFRCLLSPDREEAAIFIGMNKVISRALGSDGTSIYPCKVLNRFACPFDKESDSYTSDDNTKKPDVDYLFHLSEIAFAVELALAKAKEGDSVFRIKSAEDAYEVLTNKETLEMVLQQGVKEEHIQYKEKIVELFTKIKDRIKVEDLTVY
jgi:hypothetical protein